MTDIVSLTTERAKTHGSWIEQATMSAILKRDMRTASGWHALPAYKAEALDMLAVKIARILCGNADEPDHWDDIQGYALLGKAGHTK